MTRPTRRSLPIPPAPPAPPLRGSPEAGGDVFSRTQAKTGFLQGTGTGHQVPDTLGILGTPQNCPTQSRPGPILGLQLQSRGKGVLTLPGNPRPPPSIPHVVRAAGVGCWRLPAAQEPCYPRGPPGCPA